jgi:hypothetical protein
VILFIAVSSRWIPVVEFRRDIEQTSSRTRILYSADARTGEQPDVCNYAINVGFEVLLSCQFLHDAKNGLSPIIGVQEIAEDISQLMSSFPDHGAFSVHDPQYASR